MNGTDRSEGMTGHILVVEDHEPTANLVIEAFEVIAPYIECQHAASGTEAVEYLTEREDDTPVPDIVLLDLDLPGLNGFEVLQALQADESTYRPPILVFSSHTKTPNVNKSYALSANTFIAKPSDWDGFLEAVQLVMDYWFELASLPTCPKSSTTATDTIIT